MPSSPPGPIAPPESPRSLLRTLNCEPGETRLWASAGFRDDDWDAFVGEIPSGQYQQSTGWAEFKASQGWKVHRVIATRGDRPIGGYQLLWKKKRWVGLGDLRKGPVLADPQDTTTLRLLYDCLITDLKRLGIHAAFHQPPDADPERPEITRQFHLLPCNPLGAAEATAVLATTEPVEALRSRMSRATRYQINKATKLGVQVRVGTGDELGTFFNLMLGSCQRQKTSPNPASLKQLQRFWSGFHRMGAARLTFAEVEGQPICTVLCILWNRKAYVWKKGWNSEHGDKFPNQMLYMELIDWAQKSGLLGIDHEAISRQIAERVLSGVELTEEEERGRDSFFLRFGATPVLLHRPALLIPSSVPRAAVRLAFGFSRRYPALTASIAGRMKRLGRHLRPG